MAITLSDIPAAVKTYLNASVRVKVVSITPAAGSSINPNELFTIQLTVTNANSANGGIALNNLKVRLALVTPGGTRLLVPNADGTSVDDAGAPLPAGLGVNLLNFIPTDRTLPVGAIRTFSIQGKAGGPGFGIPTAQTTQFQARAFADVDLDQLFPKGDDTAEIAGFIHVAAT